MAHIITVTDFEAPELDVYARLTGSQLKNRRHAEQGVFIAESAKVIGHALDAGYRPLSLLMEEDKLSRHTGLLERCGDVPVYTARREVLSRLTGYALTRGVLCAMGRRPVSAVESVCSGARRIAVLDGIVDPTNVGAILRSAAALNWDAVLLTPTCCDPLHRRAVRVSMGTVFQVPWAWLGEHHSHWPTQGMERLHRMGFHVAALALDERSIPVDHPALKAAERLAVVLGTEGDGLSAETIALCDDTVKIPMGHGVDSLNVAAASAVAFWELGRRG